MANKGKIVIVACLDGTFQRKGFGTIPTLIPLAEDVVKLSAVCVYCFEGELLSLGFDLVSFLELVSYMFRSGLDAAFSKRIGAETEVEVIGGSDKYVAVCRECFHQSAPKTVGHVLS